MAAWLCFFLMETNKNSHTDGVTSRLRCAAQGALLAVALYGATSPAQAYLRSSQTESHVNVQSQSGVQMMQSLDDMMHQGIVSVESWVRTLVPYLQAVSHVPAPTYRAGISDAMNPLSARYRDGEHVLRVVVKDDEEALRLKLQDVVGAMDIHSLPADVLRHGLENGVHNLVGQQPSSTACERALWNARGNALLPCTLIFSGTKVIRSTDSSDKQER